MTRSRFTEDQTDGILKQHEAGVSVDDLCSKHCISYATIFKWKDRNGVVSVSGAKRPKGHEDENTHLKRLMADAMIDHAALKNFLGKSGDTRRKAEISRASGAPPAKPEKLRASTSCPSRPKQQNSSREPRSS